MHGDHHFLSNCNSPGDSNSEKANRSPPSFTGRQEKVVKGQKGFSANNDYTFCLSIDLFTNVCCSNTHNKFFHILVECITYFFNVSKNINPIIYCTKIKTFRVAFIEVLFRKTTIQAENTEKRMFGSLNKVAPLKKEEQQPRQQQTTARGTQREYSSKPLKHSIVKRILVFKR